jgi:YD repeat-containing protein
MLFGRLEQVTYTYDAENRVRTVTKGGSTWTYTYDYLGRRVRKTGPSGLDTRYLYEGWNLIAEVNSAGTLGRKFAWGLDASGSPQGHCRGQVVGKRPAGYLVGEERGYVVL